MQSCTQVPSGIFYAISIQLPQGTEGTGIFPTTDYFSKHCYHRTKDHKLHHIFENLHKVLYWVATASSQAPTQPLAHPLSGIGEKVHRTKTRSSQWLGYGQFNRQKIDIHKKKKSKKKKPQCPTGRIFPANLQTGDTLGPKLPPLLSSSTSAFMLNLTLHVTQPLAEPTHWAGRVGKRKPWRCASTAQQQPKHLCIINTALAINPTCYGYDES